MNDTDNTQTAPAVAPAPMLETEARTMSMLIHVIAAVAALLSAGTISWLAPLVIWLMYKERSALVDHHGKANLNLQLTSLVVMVSATIVGILLFGVGLLVTLPLAGLYLLYAIIISFVAGARASSGEYYRIPMVIPFLR